MGSVVEWGGLPKPQAGLEQQLAMHTLSYIAIPIQTTRVPLHRSTYSNIRAGYISFGQRQRHLKRIDGLSSAPQSTTHQSFIFMLLLFFQPDSLGASMQIHGTITKNCCEKKIGVTHFMCFFSALRDRIKSTGAKRGRLRKYWWHETETKLAIFFTSPRDPTLLGQLP